MTRAATASCWREEDAASFSFTAVDASDTGGWRHRRQHGWAAALSCGALAASAIIISCSRWAPRASAESVISLQLLDIDGPVANTCGRLDVDMDYQYATLAGVGHLDNVVSSQDCCRLCQGEPSCKAFTWVKDAHLLRGNPGQCWLKGGEYASRGTRLGVFSAFVRDPETELRVLQEEEEERAKKKAEAEAEAKAKALAVVKAREAEAKAAERREEAEAEAEAKAEDKKVAAEAEAKARVEKAEEEASPEAAAGKEEKKKKAAADTSRGRIDEAARGGEESTTIQMPTSSSAKVESTTTTRERRRTATITKMITAVTMTSGQSRACCSFEPFIGCGEALNISYYCDLSPEQCEEQCAGRWLDNGAKQITKGLDVQPPPSPKPTPPPQRHAQGPCCSFEPLKACGDELAISAHCDKSQAVCERQCAGRWLEDGPEQKPEGMDLYSEWKGHNARSGIAPSSPAMRK